VAGRSLPLIMVVTTTFATWFGAETVMGIPAKFVQGGLNAIVEDPFGAGMCLVLVGLFFAAGSTSMNLLTIGDFYRQRFGKASRCSARGHHPELPGLGGGADHRAGPGLHRADQRRHERTTGMIVGTLAVLVYVVFGGCGGGLDRLHPDDRAGGRPVPSPGWRPTWPAAPAWCWTRWPRRRSCSTSCPPKLARHGVLLCGRHHHDAGQHPAAGRVPARDVGQGREDGAQRGAVIGGVSYILFAFVPMFIVASAVVVMGDEAMKLAEDDYQRVLPTFIMARCRW
jgi:SSS family solute:Na+ symporter